MVHCIVVVIVVAMLPVSAAWGADQRGSEAATWQFVVDQGDPQKGRQAFQDLGCGSCHRVAGEAGFPAPVSANVGPTLGKEQAAKTPGETATAIIAPSHEIGEAVARKRGADVSPMGDYSSFMTVRQLFDLVAYVRSLKASAP
jgi:mono/diheme cytochrome c family protein